MNINKNISVEEFENKTIDDEIGSVYVENFESETDTTACSVEVNIFDLDDNLVSSVRINALNHRNLASRVDLFIKEHFNDELLEDKVIYEHDFDL